MTTNNLQLETLKKALSDKGVNVPHLHVLIIATGEQLIGEAESVTVGQPAFVRNPKRVLRIQQMDKGGVSISLLVGDLDLLDNGGVYLVAQLSYKIVIQPEPAQMAILNLYKEYLDRKVLNKAEESGLVLPGKLDSPFKK